MSKQRITCNTCNGTGRVSDGWLDEIRCETCKGHGFLMVDTCSHCGGKGYVPPLPDGNGEAK